MVGGLSYGRCKSFAVARDRGPRGVRFSPVSTHMVGVQINWFWVMLALLVLAAFVWYLKR